MAQIDPTGQPQTVPVNQVQRNWGAISDQALRDPIVITAKGRPRHVLMAFDEYERLKARDRRAFKIEDMPDDIAALLEVGLAEMEAGLSAPDEPGDRVIR